MYTPLAQKLFHAVLDPYAPDAIDTTKPALAEGANPNLICEDASSTSGYVRGGLSLLVYAIQDADLKLIRALLAAGADVNLKDQLGWTPWVASLLAPDYKQKIQKLLLENGAVKHSEHLEQLCHAIYEGDFVLAKESFKTKEDLQLLSNFRVDLVQKNISDKHNEMLSFLFDNGMPCNASYLYWAIRSRCLATVELLLAKGIMPDEKSKSGGETNLMVAARQGSLDIVQVLVAAGADVNRFAFGNVEWTAAFAAAQAKHKDVAAWLKSQMSTEFLARQKEEIKGRNPKFKNLYKNATASEQLTTDEIIQVLEQWDNQFGLTVKRSDSRSVLVQLSTQPHDLNAFYAEAKAFCPDAMESEKSFISLVSAKKPILFWWD